MREKTAAPDSGVTKAVHSGQPNSGFPGMREERTWSTRAKGRRLRSSTVGIIRMFNLLKFHRLTLITALKIDKVYLPVCFSQIRGENMAVSSIIENIRVNNPKVLEAYADAMEEHAKNRHQRTEDEKSGVVTDRERTKRFMAKVLAKKGIKA